MGGLGLRSEDFAPPSVELWPENAPAMELYSRVATQWRVGAAGPVGLDYAVVFHELDRLELDRDTYDERMAAIRVIEAAALRAMRDED